MKNNYFKRAITVFAVLLSSLTAFSQGFSGPFAIANWALSAPVGGAVNTAAAPASISLDGGNGFGAGNTDYTTTYSGTCPIAISFNWSVSHPDCGYDNIYYGINGVFTFLTDCNGTGSVGPLTLNPGETLTFRVNTEDGGFGAPTLTVSNLQTTGFGGNYDPANWITTNTNSNGSVNTASAPCSITLNGSNNSSGSSGTIDYATTFTSCSVVSFSYNITHPDCGGWDNIQYGINGVFTTISSCNAVGNVGPITIPAGGTLTFRIQTVDNGGGAPTATFSNFVVVGDVIAPVPTVATLTDVTAECQVTSLTAPTATDNCSATVTVTNNAILPITTPGTTVVTWTYADGNGNTSTQTQNVVIDDVTAPLPDAATLADVTAECEVTTLAAPTATDNCSATVTVTGDVILPITTQGTTVVTWTYNDGNGNLSTQTQNIVIDDVTAPVISCPVDIVVSNDAGLCGAVVSFATPTATDNCGGSTPNILFVSDNADATEIPAALMAQGYTVTSVYNDYVGGNNATLQGSLAAYDLIYWHASGASGYGEVHNLATMTNLNAFVAAGGNVFVTGYDVIVSPDDLDLTAFLGGTYGNDIGPGYNTLVGPNSLTDGFSNIVGMTINAPNGDQDNVNGLLPGTTMVLQGSSGSGAEWSLYSTGVGGEIAWVSSGQISGSLFPAWTTPGSGYHEALLNFAYNASNSPIAISQTDLSGLNSGDVFPVGTTTIEYTATDVNGNSGICSFTVTVNDTEAPVADLMTLADITAECEVTSLTSPTATDNCATVVTVSNDATFPITSDVTVTWTYDDGNGNTTTQTQMVIIDDVTAPVADLVTLADVTAECEVTSLTAPTATDNCAGVVLVSSDAVFPITSDVTVTWTYVDGNGNTSTQTQMVIIDDVTGPIADIATLADVTATCEVTSLTAPTATDNCSSMVTVSNDAIFPITSDVTVTWTYDDGNGNTTTQAQNVIIDAVDASVSVSAATITANNSNGGVTYQWVDCDNANAPIAGATGISFTATVSGNYAVEVTEGNCTEMSNCTVIDLSAISEISADVLNVYPNPASSVMNIETSIEGTVNIFDLSGKLIYTQNAFAGKNELNVNQLATGSYTLRLTTANGTQVVRFVINRQ